MNRIRFVPEFLFVTVLAIGCGGGASPDAAATGTSEEPKLQIAAATEDAQAAAPAAVQGGGKVTGTIKFEGTAPDRDKVKMSADPVCQQQHAEAVLSEAVVVNPNGTLKNVFVYVKEGVTGSYPAPKDPVKLNQKGCWYAPHVLGIQVGQPLEIVNSDPTMHNVNAKPGNKENKAFNIAQPVKDMKTTKTFTSPEIGVPFKCNVHPWMSAYAGVVNHPFYAVSGEDGAYAIEGLPAGQYTVEAWHEKYGAQTQQIAVEGTGSATLDFSYKAQ